MPLFKCFECGCVENTALGEYYDMLGKPLCSECSTGAWHGRFPKRTPMEAGYVILEDGFYGPPGGWDKKTD